MDIGDTVRVKDYEYLRTHTNYINQEDLIENAGQLKIIKYKNSAGVQFEAHGYVWLFSQLILIKQVWI